MIFRYAEMPIKYSNYLNALTHPFQMTKPTSIPEVRWFNVESEEALKKFTFEDERLISCKLSKIYYYSRIRNAYWNTTSNIYPRDNAFHFDIGIIKNRIEKDRTRGTRFSIHEVPCIALMGKHDSIVIMKNSAESLKPFYGRTLKEGFSIKSINIKEIFDEFKPLLHVHGFILETQNVPDLVSPIYRYASKVIGSNYKLGYIKMRKDLDITYLLEVFNITHQLLRK
jgi:hypothetical protein